MPFLTDKQFARAVKDSYGEYLETFKSDRQQVRADVFKQGGWLAAHVSFPTGLDLERVDDEYLSELQTYASQKGFTNKFRLIFS